jgi:hypothetical protein
LAAVSRHKRLGSDDEDEREYRSVISTPKKPKKSFQSTIIVPPDQDFRPGDFVIMANEKDQNLQVESLDPGEHFSLIGMIFWGFSESK